MKLLQLHEYLRFLHAGTGPTSSRGVSWIDACQQPKRYGRIPDCCRGSQHGGACPTYGKATMVATQGLTSLQIERIAFSSSYRLRNILVATSSLTSALNTLNQSTFAPQLAIRARRNGT